MKYNRQLMNAILFGKIKTAKTVNVTVIKLDRSTSRLQGLRQTCCEKVRP